MSNNDVTARVHGKDYVLTVSLLQVVLATHRDSGRLVVVKIVNKSIPTGKKPDMILNERIALEKAGGSLFCTHAYAAFQTEVSLILEKLKIQNYQMNSIYKMLQKHKHCLNPG